LTTRRAQSRDIKEYVCASGGSPAPAFTASGNQSYTFKASTLYVPANYAALLTDVLNGSLATAILGSTGYDYAVKRKVWPQAPSSAFFYFSSLFFHIS
jgi:hypothetical protein